MSTWKAWSSPSNMRHDRRPLAVFDDARAAEVADLRARDADRDLELPAAALERLRALRPRGRRGRSPSGARCSPARLARGDDSRDAVDALLAAPPGEQVPDAGLEDESERVEAARDDASSPRGSACRGGGRARARPRSRAGAGRGPPRETSRACRRGRAARRDRPAPGAPAAARRGASAAPRRAPGRGRARRRDRRRAPPPRPRRGPSASCDSRARADSRRRARGPTRSGRLPRPVPARPAGPFAPRPRAALRAPRRSVAPRLEDEQERDEAARAHGSSLGG